MIIKGNFETLEKKNRFEIKDINDSRIMEIDRNIHIPNKLIIKNPANGSICMGTISHNHNTEEFILIEDEKKILHIKQYTGLSLPKFDIISPYGNFSTKPVLRKRELLLLDNTDVAANFKVNLPDYEIEIDDNRDAFYTMCVAFGITTLLPQKLLYKVLSKIS